MSYLVTDNYVHNYQLSILRHCVRYANNSEGWRVFETIKNDSDYVMVFDI